MTSVWYFVTSVALLKSAKSRVGVVLEAEKIKLLKLNQTLEERTTDSDYASEKIYAW